MSLRHRTLQLSVGVNLFTHNQLTYYSGVTNSQQPLNS